MCCATLGQGDPGSCEVTVFVRGLARYSFEAVLILHDKSKLHLEFGDRPRDSNDEKVTQCAEKTTCCGPISTDPTKNTRECGVRTVKPMLNQKHLHRQAHPYAASTSTYTDLTQPHIFRYPLRRAYGSSSRSIGAIFGSVVSGVVGIALLVCFIVSCKAKRILTASTNFSFDKILPWAILSRHGSMKLRKDGESLSWN